MIKLNCSPFFPTTDSGDVSSIKDVDMLVLLRVPSSCQPEHTDYYCNVTFHKVVCVCERLCDTALYQNSDSGFTVECRENKQWADVAIYNKVINVSTINLVGCGQDNTR